MTSLAAQPDRRELMLDALADLIVTRGSLAVTPNEIAARAGVSRPLVYAYFDSIAQMADELFARELGDAPAMIDAALGRAPNWQAAALTIFCNYLNDLVERGPLMLLILRERNKDNMLGNEGRALFQAILHRMARLLATNLELQPREAFVVLELLGSMAEAMAKMVRDDRITLATAQANLRRLMEAQLDALYPRRV